MSIRCLSLAFFAHLLWSGVAEGMWMRSASVEWWTNIADIVVVMDVESTEEIEPLNEYWNSQQVGLASPVALKGEPPNSYRFRQDYWARKGTTGAEDAKLVRHDRVLLFCAHKASARRTDAIFWTNLTKPDRRKCGHAPYDNDCKWLPDGESVLAVVKARVASENPSDRTKKRGLIVNFKANESGVHWDFVRTADPECKQDLIKQLKQGDKESAIHNLVSYPGKDTADLIRPFLKDETTTELHIHSTSSGERVVKIYPLRQVAYKALQLLGESPQKPDGYCDDRGASAWLARVGFESITYFPHGDWKRPER